MTTNTEARRAASLDQVAELEAQAIASIPASTTFSTNVVRADRYVLALTGQPDVATCIAKIEAFIGQPVRTAVDGSFVDVYVGAARIGDIRHTPAVYVRPFKHSWAALLGNGSLDGLELA